MLQLLKLPDGTVRVLVEGKTRGRLSELDESGAYLTATIDVTPAESDKAVLEEQDHDLKAQIAALMRSVVDQFENYAKLNRKLPAETASSWRRSRTPRSWPMRSPPISRSRSPTSRRCWWKPIRPSGWRWPMP